MELIEKFKYLPTDIVPHIIEYTNKIVFRYGKYIDKINEHDERYKLLRKIQRPIKINNNVIVVRMINYSNYKPSGYTIKYIINDYTIKAIIEFLVRENDGNDFYYDLVSSVNYLFDVNNNWSKLVAYNM